MTRRVVHLAAALAIAGAAAGGFFWWCVEQMNEPGPAIAQTSVVISKGTAKPGIAAQLAEAGVIDRPWLFLLDMRLTSRQELRAGEYSFPAQISLNAVIDMMHRGQVVVHRFTVAEGLTVQQVMAELRQADGLTGKVDPPPDEGSLLPETYFYSYGDSREALISRMSRAMNRFLDEEWPKRAPNLPLANKIDAISLASIVERETAIPDERPHIAAVFMNRLKQHMKLQSDPTAIYAVSGGEGVLDRPLNRDDLAFRSPYNTYLADGLPAGPICNPGRASLTAVLHPAESNDLYFVADGAGGHLFARSLQDHNRNVIKLRRLGDTPRPSK
jgi:UPF0755 protein